MTSTIEIMSEAELARMRRDDPEAGFGALRTERGALPLEAMRVEAKIDGLVAHTSVSQTFLNNIGSPMEATYIFPLPDRAAVTSFRMEVAGRIIEGIIEERQQARERYDRAIQEGHRAAITEEERSGVFTMRVGNIMPGERATVRLTLTGPVPYDEGEATFRFPLVVAPRYIPGVPLGGGDVGAGVALDTDAVPDASRISPPVLLPGFAHPVRLDLRVELRDARLPLSRLRSSLHSVIESGGDGARTIEVRPGERLDRDFILRWSLSESDVRTSLLLHPDASGDQGTFLLTLVPPASLSRSTKPRDVVFVLDRSGSMGGWKMVAARRAVGRMVDTLRDRDRFTVCAFDDSLDFPSDFGDRLVDATDRNRFRALEFLAQVDARGGTEMAAPLSHAAGKLAGGYQDRERAIVLVTDGQIGNEDQILRMLAPNLRNVRIFCVGIDQSVNAGFLKRLSDLGGGLSELVESEDRLDEVMDRIHRRIGTPVLTELSLIGQDLQIDTATIAPHRLPDLFAGAPVVIGGRYRGRSGAVRLSGTDASGRAFGDTIPSVASHNGAVASIWARARVRDLEDRFVLTHDTALEKEIVSTSIRFSVLCRFTAFVAVDEAERVNPGGRLTEMVQPVEAPEGWGMFNAAAAAPMGGKGRGHRRRSAAPVAKAMDMELDDGFFQRRGAPDFAARPEKGKKEAYDVVDPDVALPPLPAPRRPAAIDAGALIELVRRTTDPVVAAALLVQELPRIIGELRRQGSTAVQELEELLAKMGAPRAGAGELAVWIARALELLEPGRPRAFWK